MLSFIVNIFLSTFVLLLTARMIPGLEINNIGLALISCLMIGLVNFLVRPMILLLTLPATPLTVGFFTFIINALILNLATGLVDEFGLRSWSASLLGSFILTLFRLFLDTLRSDRRKLIS